MNGSSFSLSGREAALHVIGRPGILFLVLAEAEGELGGIALGRAIHLAGLGAVQARQHRMREPRGGRLAGRSPWEAWREGLDRLQHLSVEPAPRHVGQGADAPEGGGLNDPPRLLDGRHCLRRVLDMGEVQEGDPDTLVFDEGRSGHSVLGDGVEWGQRSAAILRSSRSMARWAAA